MYHTYSHYQLGLLMSKKRKSHLDYHANDTIVCPYCDFKHEDVYDFMSNHGEDRFEIECYECEKSFHVQQRVEYTFTTYGDCKVHKLWRYGGKHKGRWSYTCQTCAQEFYDHDLHDGKYPKLKEHEYEIIEDDSDTAWMDGI